MADMDTIKHLLPEAFLIGLAMWIYVGGTVSPRREWWIGFALACYVVIGFNLFRQDAAIWGALEGGAFASGPLVIDPLGHSLRWLALAMGVVFTLVAAGGLKDDGASEFLATLMLLTAGVMVTARANDMVLMFVGLELVSIPTYVLLYMGRSGRAGAEATAKYFFLSILSSSFLLYGFSFLYGIAGTTTLVGAAGESGLREALSHATAGEMHSGLGQFAPFALILVIAGLGFRLAAVPFHFYAPDVYEGGGNAASAVLSTAPKVVGVVGLVRIVVISMPNMAVSGWHVLLVLSVLTMTLGNTAALWQRNVRRMLAYSSIAHAGYLLIGVSVALVGAREAGVSASLVYLAVYVAASAGAFAVLAYIESEGSDPADVDDLAGLGVRHPMVAGAMAVFMFSLAGIPPLAGFWGKFELFSGTLNAAFAREGSAAATWLAVLAIVGALNAAIGAAYYLRIIGAMYFQSADTGLETARRRGSRGPAVAAAICAAIVVGAGVSPSALAFAFHIKGPDLAIDEPAGPRGNDDSARLTVASPSDLILGLAGGQELPASSGER